VKGINVLEAFILIFVLVSVVVVPFAIFRIDEYIVSSKYPENAQIITLYGISKGGIWTTERVTVFNYWWKKFKHAEEIPIYDDGTPIIFRVTSTDVIHSFSIPLFRVGPYEIKPGQFTVIEVKTERRMRSTKYLCYQYCDEDHEKMQGRLVVME